MTRVKIADLQPHKDNYNRHPDTQIEELGKSLEMFGQFKNIVVSQGKIIAGHGLVEAAKRKGLNEIDALVMNDLTEEQQQALMIADNVLPTLATPDLTALQSLLKSLSCDVPGILKDMTPFQIPEVKNEVDQGTTKAGYYDKIKMPIQIGRLLIFVGEEEQHEWGNFDIFYERGADELLNFKDSVFRLVGELADEIRNSLK